MWIYSDSYWGLFLGKCTVRVTDFLIHKFSWAKAYFVRCQHHTVLWRLMIYSFLRWNNKTLLLLAITPSVITICCVSIYSLLWAVRFTYQKWQKKKNSSLTFDWWVELFIEVVKTYSGWICSTLQSCHKAYTYCTLFPLVTIFHFSRSRLVLSRQSKVWHVWNSWSQDMVLDWFLAQVAFCFGRSQEK